MQLDHFASLAGSLFATNLLRRHNQGGAIMVLAQVCGQAQCREPLHQAMSTPLNVAKRGGDSVQAFPLQSLV